MRLLPVLALLAACSPSAPDPAPPESVPIVQATAAPEKLVVAFGDSLYAGYGVLPQQSFPYRLEQALKGRGLSVEVRNAGVSGETTAGGRARLASAIDGLGRKPDLVLVGLGGNDMLLGIDPGTVRANLDAICAELRRRRIAIVLTGMVAAPQRGADYARAFDAIWPELAKRHDAGLDPFFLAGVVFDRDLMLADGLHPAPKGIERITARVAPLVAARLEHGGTTGARRAPAKAEVQGRGR